MSIETDDELLTSQEAAAKYGVTVQLLRQWELSGLGPAPFRRGGIKRYRKAEVLADIAAGGDRIRVGAVA